MRSHESTSPRFRTWWIASWAVPCAAQLSLTAGPWSDRVIGSATLLFWLVLVAASLCAVSAGWVIRRSFRTGEADLGVLGLFVMSTSLLPLVHGITTPGVLYGDNSATYISVLISIPLGLVAAAPFALRRHPVADRLRTHWRGWIIGWLGAMIGISTMMLVDPNRFPKPSPRQPLTVTIALVSVTGCILLSRRHLHLARISGRLGSLIVPAGYGLLGSSAFVWLVDTPLSFGFWAAHLLDIAGVFTASIGALVVYRRSDPVRQVLAPVLAVEPLRALEVGLDPLVHRFVADLERKDTITRDHVVRTSALAVRTGERLGLDATHLRRVGLTALLHDVGKLEIPDEILDKPSALTDDEFDVIKRHPIIGERLVSTNMPEISAGIRGHHERIDGRGYPDALAGDEIPFDARLVSVCDAFDAMANTRQYRDGMGADRAIAILKEHAGAQWDEELVDAVADVIRRDPQSGTAGALDDAGRHGDQDNDHRVGCDCIPDQALAR